jgi:hypothetical protein
MDAGTTLSLNSTKEIGTGVLNMKILLDSLNVIRISPLMM